MHERRDPGCRHATRSGITQILKHCLVLVSHDLPKKRRTLQRVPFLNFVKGIEQFKVVEHIGIEGEWDPLDFDATHLRNRGGIYLGVGGIKC